MAESGEKGDPSGSSDVPTLVDHLFRRKAGQMVAALTRFFGPENIHLAEDVVQDTLLKALRKWSYLGIPDNPEGWLFKTAKNHALDILRREKRFRGKLELILADHDRENSLDPVPVFDDPLNDNELTLIFICCHPVINRESQVALALKMVGGFGKSEIAGAFLIKEKTVAQRLVRAKKKLRESQVSFKMPGPKELAYRVDAVLEVILLIFNEGYSATTGDSLIRQDLCGEAIRLATMLTSRPVGDLPKAHALLALLHFQNSRSEARVDTMGNLLLLSEQDRSQWDQKSLEQGCYHLKQAMRGEKLSQYHLMAGIAASHASAENFEGTNWHDILFYYNQLSEINRSPVLALNRIVALGMINGPGVALSELEKLSGEESLQNYYLLPATKGEMNLRDGNATEAKRNFELAYSLATNSAEKRFLKKRIGQC